MGIFDKIKAQVNVFDGGKTWKNPSGPPPGNPGGILGLLNRDVVNPVRRVINPNYGLPQTLSPAQINNTPESVLNRSYGPTAQGASLVPQPGILNRLLNTANNDVLLPTHRGIVGAIQAANPWDAQSKGGSLVNSANSQYGFTPQFMQTVRRTSPQLVSGSLDAKGGLSGGAQAGGLYQPQSSLNNAINITSSYGSTPTVPKAPLDMSSFSRMPKPPPPPPPQRQVPASSLKETMLHEGLHAAWQTQPQTRQQFQKAYSQSLTPDLKDYLAYRLQNYKVFQNNPNLLDNISKAPRSVQTEVHSYIPEYYDMTAQQMPPALQKHYSQFYNTQSPVQRRAETQSIGRLMPRLFPDNGVED